MSEPMPISALFNSAPRSVIKSIQRGVIAFGASIPSAVEVTISPVDPAKSFVNLLGCADRGTVSSYLTIELKNATTIRGVIAFGAQLNIPWEVVEYY